MKFAEHSRKFICVLIENFSSFFSLEECTVQLDSPPLGVSKFETQTEGYEEHFNGRTWQKGAELKSVR